MFCLVIANFMLFFSLGVSYIARVLFIISFNGLMSAFGTPTTLKSFDSNREAFFEALQVKKPAVGLLNPFCCLRRSYLTSSCFSLIFVSFNLIAS